MFLGSGEEVISMDINCEFSSFLGDSLYSISFSLDILLLEISKLAFDVTALMVGVLMGLNTLSYTYFYIEFVFNSLQLRTYLCLVLLL